MSAPDVIGSLNAVSEIIRSQSRKIFSIHIDVSKKNDDRYTKLIKGLKAPVEWSGKAFFDKFNFKHQGIIVQCSPYPYKELSTVLNKEEIKILICDSIVDPQNFGSICRTAHCFGIDAIVISKDRAVDVTPTVVMASSGASERIAIAKVTNISRTIEELKEAGFWVFAADMKAKAALKQIKFSPKSAVVLGNEGEGIRPLVLKNCDEVFYIPMKGDFDSLNVAQSAAVILYEWCR